ncbi:hypothetical protein CEXT_90911, partial [Caerostris extrusa]
KFPDHRSPSHYPLTGRLVTSSSPLGSHGKTVTLTSPILYLLVCETTVIRLFDVGGALCMLSDLPWTLTIFAKYRTMNTLKYIRLREEGSLNERLFKGMIVQKCDWTYEDFQTAEMVQDSTMRTLQGRFRKEDDENTCLQRSVDTLMTVGRIVRRTSELLNTDSVILLRHFGSVTLDIELLKFRHAHLFEKSEETICLVIAKVVNKVVKKYLQYMGLKNSLKFWRDLDDWLDDSEELVDLIPKPYPISKIWNLSDLSSNV